MHDTYTGEELLKYEFQLLQPTKQLTIVIFHQNSCTTLHSAAAVGGLFQQCRVETSHILYRVLCWPVANILTLAARVKQNGKKRVF